MKKLFRMTAFALLFLFGILLVAGLLFLNFSPQLGAKATGERLNRMQASPNYKDGVFQNMVPTSLDMSVPKMVQVSWRMLRGVADSEPSDTIRTVPFDAKRFEGNRSSDVATPGVVTPGVDPSKEVAISWFGHSSVLIRVQGQTFLTDPVFGERASMFSFVGPRRFPYDQYMDVEGLPRLDGVILSHDHYDHLDYGTFQKLKQKASRFFVPLGVGAHLEKWGIPAAQITELDWHESVRLGELTLVCAPARHFSGRGFSRNGTLWASWALLGTQRRVYYGGDSGYYPGFKEIGAKYGPFDVALLECGAYDPDWIDIHMLPEQTAQAQIDVKANLLIPIHWGKFNLALHAWRDPIQRLLKRSAELGTKVATPRIGEVVVLSDPLPTTHWWEAIP